MSMEEGISSSAEKSLAIEVMARLVAQVSYQVYYILLSAF